MNQASIEGKRDTISRWADIAGQILDKLMGKNVSMTYSFENLKIEIPRAEGPGGQHIGGAQWTINGKIMVRTETYDKDTSNHSKHKPKRGYAAQYIMVR